MTGWILVHNSLTSIPRHYASAVNEGKFAQETPEETAMFARLRAKYPHNSYWDNFGQAFGIVLRNTEGFSGTEDGPPGALRLSDPLGAVYMLTSANEHAGQFFTPWNVADIMAQMTIGDGFARSHPRAQGCPCQSHHERRRRQSIQPVPSLISRSRPALADKDEDYLDYGDNYVFPLLRPFADPITHLRSLRWKRCHAPDRPWSASPSGLSGMASFSSTAWTLTPPASSCAKPISCCTVSQGHSPAKMRSPRRQK